MLLNNEWVKNESKEEVKKLLEIMKMNSQQPKLMGHSKGSPEREIHSNTGQVKKDRNISNKQPKPTSTKIRGTTTKRAQSR